MSKKSGKKTHTEKKKEKVKTDPTGGMMDMLGSFMSGVEGLGEKKRAEAKVQEEPGKIVVSTSIFGPGIKDLSSLKNLKSLNLESCQGLSDPDMQGLGEMTELEVLNLSGSGITGECFKFCSDLKKLKELYLLKCPNLKDKELRELGHLESLEILKISGAKIDGDCFKGWENLKNLKILVVQGCHLLADRNLKYLQGLESLEYLELSGFMPTL